MFRVFFAAYMAIPFLAAATFNGSAVDLLSCSCGQCEDGCGCCAVDVCSCGDCVCEGCDIKGSSSLVSTTFVAEGETPSCCAGGSCSASKDRSAGSSTLVSSQKDCKCADCSDGCEGCKDCGEGECVCTECDAAE